MARATLSPDQDKIMVETLFREKDLVKQIPGASWNHKQSTWYAPLSWGTCVILRGVFGQQLEIGDDLGAWAMNELDARVNPANALREAIDAPGSPKLFGYQRAGVEFLMTARRALLADGLGAGKTRQAIMTAMRHYQNGENPFPILAVVPNSTKMGWKREAAQVWPGLEVQIIKGSAKQRREQLETPAHLYVINWEAVRGHSRLKGYGNIALKRCKECGGEDERISHNRCEVHKRELNQIDFGMVIADECFLGHVLVDTPYGKRTMDSLRSGDVIWGYDHKTSSVIESRVTATMHRPAAAVVDVWAATPNHPFYTVGSGYRRLGDLDESDELYAISDAGVPGLQPRVHSVRVLDAAKTVLREELLRAREWRPGGVSAPLSHNARISTMRTLSNSVSAAVQKEHGAILLEVVCDKVAQHDAGSSGTFAAINAQTPRRSNRGREPENVLAQRPQPVPSDESGRAVAAREANLAAHGVWSTLDKDNADRTGSSRALTGIGAGLAAGDDGRRGTAELLRAGHSVSGAQVNRGSGRVGASRAQGVRRSSDTAPRNSGLRRHEVLELRSVERYARVCAESALPAGETQTVYSLTTETGNYFANGVLVSNCHRMKDPTAKQTRAVWAATGDAPFRYALTGTPIADAPDDLWAILHWLDPNEWPSRVKYIDRFCNLQYNAFGAPIVTGLRPDTKDEFFRIVNPRMRRMPKELVLSYLPPVLRERRDVEMTPKQAKAYKEMSEKLVTDLDGDVLTAASPLTKMTRLIQFSSSYAEIEETINPENGKTDTKVRLVEPSCKIDAFMSDMPDFGDDSVVVFAQSRQLIYLLHDRLEKEGIPHGLITGMQNQDERQKSIDDFQEGKTKYVLATLGAGGTGLTLTAARIAVYLQRSWSLIENEQSEGRVHRIGSEIHESILYIDYVTAESVEEIQHMAVAAKGERLEEILRDKDLLRRALLNEDVSAYLQQDIHDAAHNDGATEGLG